MRWPWSRKDEDPPSAAPAPEPAAAPAAALPEYRRDWRNLPPVQRVLDGGQPLVNPPQAFTDGLASWRPTGFLSPLSHAVAPEGPSGVVEAVPVASGQSPDMPVVHTAAPPSDNRPLNTQRTFDAAPPVLRTLPVVQRSEDAAGSTEAPEPRELPVVGAAAPHPEPPEAAPSPSAPTLGLDAPEPAPAADPPPPVPAAEPDAAAAMPLAVPPTATPIGPPVLQRSTVDSFEPPSPSRRRAGIGPPLLPGDDTAPASLPPAVASQIAAPASPRSLPVGQTVSRSAEADAPTLGGGGPLGGDGDASAAYAGPALPGGHRPASSQPDADAAAQAAGTGPVDYWPVVDNAGTGSAPPRASDGALSAQRLADGAATTPGTVGAGTAGLLGDRGMSTSLDGAGTGGSGAGGTGSDGTGAGTDGLTVARSVDAAGSAAYAGPALPGGHRPASSQPDSSLGTQAAGTGPVDYWPVVDNSGASGGSGTGFGTGTSGTGAAWDAGADGSGSGGTGRDSGADGSGSGSGQGSDAGSSAGQAFGETLSAQLLGERGMTTSLGGAGTNGAPGGGSGTGGANGSSGLTVARSVDGGSSAAYAGPALPGGHRPASSQPDSSVAAQAAGTGPVDYWPVVDNSGASGGSGTGSGTGTSGTGEGWDAGTNGLGSGWDTGAGGHGSGGDSGSGSDGFDSGGDGTGSSPGSYVDANGADAAASVQLLGERDMPTALSGTMTSASGQDAGTAHGSDLDMTLATGPGQGSGPGSATAFGPHGASGRTLSAQLLGERGIGGITGTGTGTSPGGGTSGGAIPGSSAPAAPLPVTAQLLGDRVLTSAFTAAAPNGATAATTATVQRSTYPPVPGFSAGSATAGSAHTGIPTVGPPGPPPTVDRSRASGVGYKGYAARPVDYSPVVDNFAPPVVAQLTAESASAVPPAWPPPTAVQRADAASPPPDPAPPPAADAAAPAGGAAPAAAGAAAATADPTELLAKLYDPLLRRLRAELRHDRERRGALTDLWH